MRRRLMLVTMGSLLAISSSAGVAAAASSPLLSGYGGPGQGNQAILGATLLNGPSGGGGSGGAGSSNGGGTANTTLTGSTRAAGSEAGGPQRGSRTSGSRREGKRAGGASAEGSHAYSPSSGLAVGAAAAYATPTLGISGADLVYIFLAMGALVLTAAFTARLARRAP